MSAPAGRGNDSEDPLLYVPRWGRGARSQSAAIVDAPPTAPAEGSTSLPIEAPPMAPGLGGPNIELPPSLQRPFAGDLAIRDLRHRLALDPELVPEPPLHLERPPALPWIGRFAFVVVSAALAAFLVMILTVPNPARRDAMVATVAPIIDEWVRGNRKPIRLVVESQRGFANEPLPLGVALNNSAGSEMLTLVGLASGTRLSAGAPLGLTGWQLPARELGNAFAYAPKDFVGIMNAAVDLRSPRDRLMDSQIVRLEWMPKKEGHRSLAVPNVVSKPDPAPMVTAALDPDEIATLIKRADDFLAIGDIAAARLVLRRAAGAGNAKAALALGMTYDPAVLEEQGVLGLAPDVAQARVWYERALHLGSVEARRRLEWLGQGVR